MKLKYVEVAKTLDHEPRPRYNDPAPAEPHHLLHYGCIRHQVENEEGTIYLQTLEKVLLMITRLDDSEIEAQVNTYAINSVANRESSASLWVRFSWASFSRSVLLGHRRK